MIIATRFWAKVEIRQDDACWEWQGARNARGYGVAWDGQKTTIATRLVWRLVFGSYPDDQVLHHCDTPACVRPDHLWLGTLADNMADMMRKGRSSAGRPRPSAQGDNHWARKQGRLYRHENNPGAKLTPEAVAYIRANYAPRGKGGISAADLARDFKVSSAAISKIIVGKNWK